MDYKISLLTIFLVFQIYLNKEIFDLIFISTDNRFDYLSSIIHKRIPPLFPFWSALDLISEITKISSFSWISRVNMSSVRVDITLPYLNLARIFCFCFICIWNHGTAMHISYWVWCVFSIQRLIWRRISSRNF